MNTKKKISLIIVIFEIIALIVVGFFAYRTVDSLLTKHEQEELAAAKKAEEEEKLKQEELKSWNLILINPWNAVPDGYEVEIVEAERGFEVDARIYDAFAQMMADCRAAGYSPLLIAGHRSHDAQQRLYDKATNKADTALPYHSEHEIGLAVDIVDSGNSSLTDAQANTPAQQWLMKNCQNYGFILRYPKDKVEITGIVYEPWHYRYVGVKHAKKIMKKGICLEEYLENY